MKQCTKCGEVRDLFEFYKRPETKDGLRKDCKKCFSTRSSKNWNGKTQEERKRINTRNRLQYYYNLSVENYQQMLDNQEHKCYICGASNTSSGKCLFVDHCHISGKIRKLLCQSCNSGLGMFKDNPYVLLKAAEYLKEHNG